VLRKYASLQVLEAWEAPAAQAGLRKSAHRVAFEYDPRPGYLYVRSRMISSRTNDNHDTFPAAEIEKGYRTFLGKPVFVNHHNANHRRARGVIVAVALHRDRNPDSSPDTWVEGLMEVDAHRFPKLAKAILAGKVNRTSMGVDVEWSRCSSCGNKATSPAEYCRHLPALKGQKIRKRNQATGKVEEKLIHEICAGLSFFENSLLVEDPADPTAYLLGKPDARGLQLAASRRLTAGQEGEPDFRDHIGNHCTACGDMVTYSKHPTRGGFRHYRQFGYDHPAQPSDPSDTSRPMPPEYGGTHCLMCHEPVKVSLNHLHTATGGWSHHDGLKRDHPAIPTEPWKVYHAIPGIKAAQQQAVTEMGDHLHRQFEEMSGHPMPRKPRGDEDQMPPDPFTAALQRTAELEWGGQAAADADNLYHLTSCHHAACGRTLGHRRTAVDIDESRLDRAPDPAIHPVRAVAEGARSYASKAGLPEPHAGDYSHIETNPDRIRRLAHAYDALPMSDPGAHHAFTDMARQVHHQYDHLTKTMGVKVESVDHDPYASHLDMAHDLEHNKRLQVLSTRATGPHGFFDNDTNDKFRAVHDAFGHAATGRSFDRHGEEAAWLAHSRMFSGPARHAMTTETRGQNSMLISTGKFAPQKTALLPHEFMQRDAALRDEAAKRPGGDHPFFHETPMHPDHIVAAYHGTSSDEKSLGDRWYSDAHHVAGAIAHGNHALGAGLLSAYSPQTAWPINLHNASRAAQGDPPGPGSGAMGSQQKPAIRMLAGEHHSQVLNGPKTRAFAKLIEHGGDTPEDKASGNHQVVIDRHALSVAAGRRLSKDEGGKFPASQTQHYEHVAHMYRDAAHTLSQHFGREIAPHAVQAATWLRQQRMNQAEDSAGQGGGGSGASKGRVKTFTNGQERWTQHHQEAHPGGIPEENMHYHGHRRQAYGETRVPPEVDTLRMEECPVCGEGEVWSGDRCPVCGFIVPPSLFRDPDTSKAQDVRDELDQTGEVTTQPGAPGDPSTQPVGSDPDADGQMVHPDQIAPDGVPAVQGEGGQPQPGAPMAQQPGQDAEEQGDAEAEQGEQDQEMGQEEQAEGQQAANDGEEEQLEPQGGLSCPACGQSFAPDMAAQPGVPCPACRQGALEPAGGPQKEQEDPSEEEDEGNDMPGSKTGAAIAQAQAGRIAELSARNEVLTAQLSFLARAAGADQHLAAIERDVMRRHADMLNPASPVPDPPEAPATESTEQALQPEAQDDPSRPGTTPGSVTHVPAEQTTTSITPGVEIQTPPATNLTDVTAPVTGTNPAQDGGVPIEQRRIETDVRVNPDPLAAHGPGIGGEGDNGAAFPWLLQDGQHGPGQKAASRQVQGYTMQTSNGGEEAAAARTFGAIRLARLRVQAGLAQGDELAVAERIERDAGMSGAMIEHEIKVLASIPRQAAPRAPMPRQAARQAPSLASVGAAAHYAPAAVTDDLDGSDIFLD